MNLTNLVNPPLIAATPLFTSGKENIAFSVATTISHAKVISIPPPVLNYKFLVKCFFALNINL